MKLEDKTMKKLDIIYTKKNEEKSNRPDICKAVTKYNLKKEHQYLKKKNKEKQNCQYIRYRKRTKANM